MASASTSAWSRSTEVTDGYQRYQYNKIPQASRSLSDLSVTVCIFSGTNKRTEIYVKTYDQEKYFRIIDVAQKHLPKMDRYYFDSSYNRFPRDKDELCTVDAVKNLRDRFSVYKDLFENTFLESNLGRCDGYDTSEQLFSNIKEALTVLKEVDPSITEIQQDMESIEKASS